MLAKTTISMRSFFTCLLLIFFIISVKAQEDNFPKWTIGHFHDYEHILTSDQFTDIEILINKTIRETKCQITVISISNIGTYSDFNDYAIELSNRWKIGKYYDGKGISIIFSKTLKQVRISTTDNIRDEITDQFCQEIIDNILIPSFKKDDFYSGIKNAILAIKEEFKQ